MSSKFSLPWIVNVKRLKRIISPELLRHPVNACNHFKYNCRLGFTAYKLSFMESPANGRIYTDVSTGSIHWDNWKALKSGFLAPSIPDKADMKLDKRSNEENEFFRMVAKYFTICNLDNKNTVSSLHMVNRMRCTSWTFCSLLDLLPCDNPTSFTDICLPSTKKRSEFPK